LNFDLQYHKNMQALHNTDTLQKPNNVTIRVVKIKIILL
jgi:hypothetical protein